MGDVAKKPRSEKELVTAIAQIIFSESNVLHDQLAKENELKEGALLEIVICFFFLADVVIARRVRRDWISLDLREDVLDEIKVWPKFTPSDKAVFDDTLSKRMRKYIVALTSAQSFGVFHAMAAVLAGYALVEPVQGPLSLAPIGFMAGAVLGVFRTHLISIFRMINRKEMTRR